MSVVTFVGLGAMGFPMAQNLLQAGMQVCGVDLSDQALERFAAAGGSVAKSVAEVQLESDFLILMVINIDQAKQVLMQEQVLARLKQGCTVVLMATCPSPDVAALGQYLAERGIAFLDAPVSGGVEGAKAASLTIMAAGDRATYDKAVPILQHMGQRLFHVGEQAGQGAMVKTVNQLLCGVHIAVLAEALALAAKVGVDLSVVLEIMSGSSASSWMLRDRGPRMIQDDPEVTSAVDIFVKDLGIVLQTGTQVRAALPIAATAQQMFLAASGSGLALADDSQVIQSYYALSGGKESK
ncbi:NAD(P)-dependent oxidoreductase [Alcaligenes endophyticus]|uniref:NAD(P)-dependent oxidoreductase n=1 Tax=Alcaligenes endophyticus TaxID=1929088 RepID=A0ABT8EJT6_9BURK|nr:NAD(P)-dependent oxidoreductase [Alcaligenes endophyticus]MCX5591864.1 NAD(P)-dependent oxidoreductase [Alcaligenes endophyticus]MDN4121554.1 NAD(P)-dependent oxidoreductase [Alcaligenes endophyticus]